MRSDTAVISGKYSPILLEERARRHFLCLGREQQLQAVRRLAAVGYEEGLIAAATGWSVEMVRHILSEGVWADAQRSRGIWPL